MKLHNILFYAFAFFFFTGCDGEYQASSHSSNSYPNNYQNLTARKRELDKSPRERLTDLQDKLQIVSRESIIKVPFLNKAEKALYNSIFHVLKGAPFYKHKNSFTILPQIPLGAFVKYEHSVHYTYYFNSLRPDFTIINNDFEPICIIEYHGSGHFGDATNMIKVEQVKVKDEMKKQILAKVNIPLIIIKNGDNFSEKLKEEFGKILALST